MDGSDTPKKRGARAAGPARQPLRRVLARTPGPLGGHRAADASRGRRRSLAWRLATPVAFVGAGALLVTSAVNSAGTDLRPSQYADLADLAEQETDRVAELQDQVAELSSDIEELSSGHGSGVMERVQEDIDALAGPAGLTPVQGPGLTVTLDDAPESVRETVGKEDEQETIVHQQDIQAVVNAMWAGGAEAMTLQGQRVVSTTGIKCVGNTVLLHGVTYSPPYVVSAIGDVEGMQERLATSPYIAAYLTAVAEWRLGWDVDTEESIEAPAYSGPADMRYAQSADQDAG
jgi:uncharacterized protein YlxW (UPF0749 family)